MKGQGYYLLTGPVVSGCKDAAQSFASLRELGAQDSRWDVAVV